ncbi:hypothetical protein BJY04DRAFT_100400 [Aspergillus karnatakaensis]|uniref:uncharacterized protein n=1 Tax=Aspergillus karnatakaensis TaxID=1810916 RepID=UPI003CCC9D4B
MPTLVDCCRSDIRFLLRFQLHSTLIVPHFAPPINTDRQRVGLYNSLHCEIWSRCTFPSSDSLTRFLAGYFTGFYPHVPFTHAPTSRVDECSPELILAMLALGAMNRYESRSAIKLFYSAKAVLS